MSKNIQYTESNKRELCVPRLQYSSTCPERLTKPFPIHAGRGHNSCSYCQPKYLVPLKNAQEATLLRVMLNLV